MLKLTQKANLKSLFLTGAVTTATLLSPLMLKEASAFNVGNNCTTSLVTSNLRDSIRCNDVSNPDGPGGANDSETLVNELKLFGSNNWDFIAKSDEPNQVLIVTPPTSGTSGDWEYESIPFQRLMIVLKGGPEFVAYLMEPGSIEGTWDTGDLINNGGQQSELSHLSVYQAVPEPLTLLGAASAIGFGSVFKKRLDKKRRDQDQA